MLVDRRGVRLDALERELEHLRDDGGLLRALGRRGGDASLGGNGNGGEVEQRAGLFVSLGIAVSRDFGCCSISRLVIMALSFRFRMVAGGD